MEVPTNSPPTGCAGWQHDIAAQLGTLGPAQGFGVLAERERQRSLRRRAQRWNSSHEGLGVPAIQNCDGYLSNERLQARLLRHVGGRSCLGALGFRSEVTRDGEMHVEVEAESPATASTAIKRNLDLIANARRCAPRTGALKSTGYRILSRSHCQACGTRCRTMSWRSW